MDNVIELSKAIKQREAKRKLTTKKILVEENFIIETSETMTQSNENFKNMKESFDKVLEVANHYKAAYLDAHQAWMRNSDMAEILIDVITMNGVEDSIITLVNEQLDLEREHDFAEHDEESYSELLHELKTRWDFLKEETAQ